MHQQVGIASSYQTSSSSTPSILLNTTSSSASLNHHQQQQQQYHSQGGGYQQQINMMNNYSNNNSTSLGTNNNNNLDTMSGVSYERLGGTENNPYPSFPLNLRRNQNNQVIAPSPSSTTTINSINNNNSNNNNNNNTNKTGCCGGSNKNNQQANTTSNNNVSPNNPPQGMHYCACKNSYQPGASDCEFQQFITKFANVPNTTPSPNSGSTSPPSSVTPEDNLSMHTSTVEKALPKANTSCLLCKLRHRKCDYSHPSCTHCMKENRQFCLYISNVKRGPKKQKDDVDSMDLDTITKDNIDTIYKTIYQNISNIKADNEVVSKLSFQLFSKIVDKLLPRSAKEDIYELMRVALHPTNEVFSGDMDHFYKYFYKIGEKEIALVSILQAIALQRLNYKQLAARLYEKARSKMSVIFDHVSDFKLIAVYVFVAIYLLGDGDRPRAEYFLNHVKFYVKEFQPTMHEAQFLLRTVLLSESILQDNYDQLLKHYENILLFFTPQQHDPENLPQSAINSISSYIVNSNEKMFKPGRCRIGDADSNGELKRQLIHLREIIDKSNQEYPIGYQHLLDSLLNSNDDINNLCINFKPESSEPLEQKIEQINMAIENIRKQYGSWDFLGNTFISMLYSIVILHKHKSFNTDEISVDAVKCADMITKSTEYDDFSLSSFPASIPLSIACKIHMSSMRNILRSSTLIIHEYSEQLRNYLQNDCDALQMLTAKFPLVEKRFSTLVKDAQQALGKYAEMRMTQPQRFVSLDSISKHFHM
ncbi:hypothetical protein NAEGRDRAFT_79829 [Naegleria gruberi]|uniref:Zn(2)-C6 fungal-type domain-containing protein n=1 Tax=Naegleria gruberi TaxID=5762 RepID=D2VFZ5_NAEGR|nr:uncharacterized protein NAEGRDRAFT_79829 [Naegleria gruberi]EFC44169.1 hypothetical protein NAEGRDRAFT_79829 [Naegleria gruberi]|eukprot:XP_002676913.1 hypothetical protein NAEGRDRAFT_79829 [Naegleria gruberi strain NEG-M]